MRFRLRLAAVAVVAGAFVITPVVSAQDSPAGEDVEVIGVGEVSADHVGEEITAGGRALEVRLIQGSGFHISFPSGFLALIPESHIHLWTGVDPVKRYPGRILQITGEVMEENGQLFIGVTDPDRMKVIERRRRRRR